MSKNSTHFLLSILLGSLALVSLLSPTAAYSATFTVVNLDGPGEGFNDATPASPVGGNTGTTIGQQRVIAFQYAANIWGSYLQSAVPIRVGGQFNPLSCTTYGGTLGSAGPTTATRDFTGAPAAGTWYPIALANALGGVDFYPSGNHINATFSSNIGTPGCMDSSGWYYGLDAAPPSGKIDFVSVLLHELGHGLGFLTFVDQSTGAKNGGYDDAYMRHLEQHGAVPADFPSMTDAQRLAASIDTGNLHWTGANVRAASGTLSAGAVGDHVRMYAPNPMMPGSSVSHWDTALTPNQIMEPSYTNPIQTPALELPLFKDIGWVVNSPAPGSYALNVAVVGLGTVTSNPSGINCGGDCSETYSTGTNVTLTATPNSGNSISGWSGACTGSTSSCTVSMSAAKSVTATFISTPQVTLSIAKIGTGTGTITRTGGAINCGSTCSESMSPGTIATISATPAVGSIFAGWSGGICSGAGACSFSVTTTTTVTANFSATTGGGRTSTPLLETNLGEVAGTMRYYTVNVPSRAKNLIIQTSGGIGDVDLYVKLGQIPTTSDADCESNHSGNEETCIFPSPAPGTYYITLRGDTSYSGVTVAATYNLKPVDITSILLLLLD